MVGKERSGTKWLTNLIASHPDVCALQREGAGGVIESNMIFWLPALVGHLRDEESFGLYHAIFCATNEFRATGLSEGEVSEVIGRGEAIKALARIMDASAKKAGKVGWVIKTSPLNLRVLKRELPDAFFIHTRRDYSSNIRSALVLREAISGRPVGVGAILKEVLLYKVLNAMIDHSARAGNNHFVTFEEISVDPRAVLSGVFNFIGLPLPADSAVYKWKPNSSFKSIDERASFGAMRAVKVIYFVSCIVPGAIYAVMGELLAKIRYLYYAPARGKKFVRKSFSQKMASLIGKGHND